MKEVIAFRGDGSSFEVGDGHELPQLLPLGANLGADPDCFKYRGKKHAACSRSGGFTVPCRRGNCVPPAPWACRCFLLARSSGDPFHGRFPSTERVLRRGTLIRSLGVRTRGGMTKEGRGEAHFENSNRRAGCLSQKIGRTALLGNSLKSCW